MCRYAGSIGDDRITAQSVCFEEAALNGFDLDVTALAFRCNVALPRIAHNLYIAAHRIRFDTAGALNRSCYISARAVNRQFLLEIRAQFDVARCGLEFRIQESKTLRNADVTACSVDKKRFITRCGHVKRNTHLTVPYAQFFEPSALVDRADHERFILNKTIMTDGSAVSILNAARSVRRRKQLDIAFAVLDPYMFECFRYPNGVVSRPISPVLALFGIAPHVRKDARCRVLYRTHLGDGVLLGHTVLDPVIDRFAKIRKRTFNILFGKAA